MAATENAQNVTVIAQRAISRNLEILSLSLDTLAYRYREPLNHRLSEDQRRVFLFESAPSVSHIVVMAVLGADGKPRASSLTRSNQFTRTYADRPYFTAHRDSPDLGLFISQPIRASLGNELPIIVLSKRLQKADGSFDGVVLMALDLAYFRDLFANLALGPEGVMSLYSDQGVVYMRMPYKDAVIGSDLGVTSDFQRTRAHFAAHQGSFLARSRQDGVQRLYTFTRVPHTQLMVFVGNADAAIYKEWYESFYSTLFVLAAFGCVCAVLYKRLRQEFHARAAIERQLTQLARTDTLTGLLNRRAIDELLGAAWGRHQQHPAGGFCILFIDIDYFKLYNDTYGHKAGDAALRAVAQSAAGALARSSDHAARYGGEEFIVLLGDTDQEGALHVAQRIRAAIHACAIVHERSPLGVVTASIGLACLRRDRHRRIEDVINAADEALYRSKSAGRDRVTAAD
ncbi:diguanylate cyclase [Herbaspirillum sp. alder98]|uniref:sensor domain-containing diguanylate cyclase n=1 Tax=Herbaspirillum sp. alder98 TaxID=2913096 RepID=UPI001CD8E1D4|nr:diguanylate cyclase [Herbaspirillum sp. alder98]MCA1326110.1 diguanylate cyclase [Herbaspirillum sp. alder98]